MLRHYIHCHFAKIEISAYACGSSDTCLGKYVAYDGHGKFMGRHSVCGEVICDINKHLIDGIYMDIFLRYIVKVYLVYTCTVIYVELHTRNGSNELAALHLLQDLEQTCPSRYAASLE